MLSYIIYIYIYQTLYIYLHNLLVLDVVGQEVQSFGLFTVVGDGDARSTDDLGRVTFGVDLAQAGPLAELLGVRDMDQGDLLLGAESCDERLVHLLVARVGQKDNLGFATVDGLGDLMETLHGAIAEQGVAEDLSHGSEDIGDLFFLDDNGNIFGANVGHVV